MNEIIGLIFYQYVGFGGILSLIFALIQILKERSLKNFILFLIFVSMSFFLLKGLVLLNGFGLVYSHYFSFEIFFIFLIGPSLFIYFNLLLLNEKVNLRILLPHYIPAVLFLIVYVFDTVYLILGNFPLNDLNEKFEGRYDLIYGISTIITLTYMLVILVKFVQLFKGNISDYPWSKHIILILGVGFAGVITNILMDFRSLLSLNAVFVELYFLALGILTLTVLYAFVISQIYPITFNAISESFQKMSYQKSTLQNIDPKDLAVRLETLMMQDKVYLEVGITLNQLAKKLNIKSHQLSELLNNNLNKSFFTYINQFRIQEAKARLLSEKESSVIKIAFDSGFNSLSVFNTVFKKEVGMTPSQFRKKNS
ncbi:helix-turn-helix transcriptional regulator [Leptospira sp. 201903071]|uniref:helix-turn-helix domain-containing protein n=1 Tax=Leptospira ainazelensis TaxID=2810034 RepID=UPI001963B2F2|nr:helix-turn-helix domain-containing protein [Leptospira ainazelensis]MBM9502363.1 helix-turn-helix transcriptional regulator [Leptospira ainazelensis]